MGVDADEIVRKNKGNLRPIQEIEVRIQALIEKQFADAVFIKTQSGDELLIAIRPNKYFVSANRTVSPDRIALIESIGTSLVAIPYTLGISTSSLAKDAGRSLSHVPTQQKDTSS